MSLVHHEHSFSADDGRGFVTGSEIPEEPAMDYAGTFLLDNGSFVGHVFSYRP